MSKKFKLCVPPCRRYITDTDTHSLCVKCLGAQHAQFGLEGSDCVHCERLPMHLLRSRFALFEKGARAPRGSGPASVEAERRLHSWGSQMDLSEETETVSLPSSVASIPPSGVAGAVPPAPGGSPTLSLSSEEVDVLSVDAGDIGDLDDAPTVSPMYDELVEAVTLAVTQLGLDWPAEQECARPQSRLDERYLKQPAQPIKRRLPFFSDLHGELARSWSHPYSARTYSPQSNIYSNISGAKDHGYGSLPEVEPTLASYLSPPSASSLKAPSLPNKPSRITSVLVGKAFTSASQAGACLHTIGLLQASQAESLQQLAKDKETNPDVVSSLRLATDVSLRATREAAKSVGRAMAALVAVERHLWLNLSNIKSADKVFLMDSPIAPSGLFGNAVTSVVERFQETQRQAAAFRRYLPRRDRYEPAGRALPQPSCSNSYRDRQKQSVASRAPPQSTRGTGQHSHSRKSEPDLRNVIQARKASAKKRS